MWWHNKKSRGLAQLCADCAPTARTRHWAYRSGRVEEGPRRVTHSDSVLGVGERMAYWAQAERPIRGADGVRRTAIREQSGHAATWEERRTATVQPALN